MAPLVHHEEHVAYVYADAAGEVLLEVDVAREAVPVAVEGQSELPYALATTTRTLACAVTYYAWVNPPTVAERCVVISLVAVTALAYARTVAMRHVRHAGFAAFTRRRR